MNEYLVVFIIYVVVNLIFENILGQNLSYFFHVLASTTVLAYFWKKFKLKLRIDFLAITTGILIVALWILLEGKYPYSYSIEFIPENTFFLVVKLIGFVLLAPIIEELFTRSFLMRFLINSNWRRVPIGKYTISSFIITVLFFGLAHNRWLQGIMAGIILNLLLYKRKNIESCILAHFVANLILAIYIIYSGNWFMW